METECHSLTSWGQSVFPGPHTSSCWSERRSVSPWQCRSRRWRPQPPSPQRVHEEFPAYRCWAVDRINQEKRWKSKRWKVNGQLLYITATVPVTEICEIIIASTALAISSGKWTEPSQRTHLEYVRRILTAFGNFHLQLIVRSRSQRALKAKLTQHRVFTAASWNVASLHSKPLKQLKPEQCGFSSEQHCFCFPSYEAKIRLALAVLLVYLQNKQVDV